MKDTHAFLYVCGGARATWGVTSGKVCYEVKFQRRYPGSNLDASEEPSHFVRVGWSVESANLQLGEDEHSYGYDSTGNKCTNSEFSGFGQTFAKDDVITCYLDLESEAKKISFSKNGEDLGDAFDLPEDIQGKALYPHVVIRNTECTINFGSQEEAWFPPKEEFIFIQNVSDESKVRATCGPTDKKDCEVLMMIGLPASGKSTWVKKQVTENPDKKYNILGTSMVLDRMKLLGVARKQEIGGYNKNMDKAAKCLHRMFEIAPSKKRNYILDQTNVYQTAQGKKIRSFEGFQKKAVVCIPDQEVLKQRIQDRKNEGLELPHNAICDMKRNFVLPSGGGDLFDEVSYVDQDEEQSKKIVVEYTKEGNSQRTRTYSGSGEPDRKRPRQDNRQRHGGFGGGGGGGGWQSGGSHRDNRRYDDRRGGYRSPQSQYNRRGGSQQYGRGGRGGYKDNYRGGRGGYQGGGYYDRNRQGGGNRNYSSGKSHHGGSSYGNQQRQQYNYSSQQQQTSYNQQQQQTQQQGYGNYNQYYQQYGQQAQQTSPQTQSYQQYPAYYQQQGTYQQGGGYSGYGY